MFFIFSLSELPLMFLKISIFVSKLEKASVVYNPQTLPDTKAIHMRIVKYLHKIISLVRRNTFFLLYV